MAQVAVEAVVFDVGNVLLEWAPERMFDAVIGQDRRAQLFAQVPLRETNLEIDAGAPFKDTIYALAERTPDWADEIRLWHDRWLDMASPAIEHSVRLLRALRAKSVPVFALTNFGVDSFKLAEEHYPFLKEFDRRYVSGVLRVIKPNPEIYAAVEADWPKAPSSLLFADDSQRNIEAAAARGWQTHHFKDPNGWAACLVEHGLLTGDEAQ